MKMPAFASTSVEMPFTSQEASWRLMAFWMTWLGLELALGLGSGSGSGSGLGLGLELGLGLGLGLG